MKTPSRTIFLKGSVSRAVVWHDLLPGTLRTDFRADVSTLCITNCMLLTPLELPANLERLPDCEKPFPFLLATLYFKYCQFYEHRVIDGLRNFCIHLYGPYENNANFL